MRTCDKLATGLATFSGGDRDMKTQWEYDLVENPFCEQIKGMGWEWLDEARIAGANITAIEVKSGRKKERLLGM